METSRRVIGLLVAGFGFWIAWGVWRAASLYHGRAQDLGVAEVALDPAYLLPALAGVFTFFGGLTALGNRGGGVLTALGAALLLLFAGIIAAMGAQPDMYAGYAWRGAVLLVAAFVLLRLGRRLRRARSQALFTR